MTRELHKHDWRTFNGVTDCRWCGVRKLAPPPDPSADELDRQLIEDARDMASDLTDFRLSHVTGMLTDLASRLERRLDE